MITLINKDALKELKELSSESIDLIITDPPYYVLKRQEWDMQWESIDDYFYWYDNVFNEMNRVLKNGGQMYIFFSQKYMFEYARRYNPLRMLIWWHKNLSPPTNNMWLYQYDPLFYHVKGKPNYFNGHFSLGHNSDVLEYSKPQNWRNHKRHHPAEKNLNMMLLLIDNSSKIGDIVLDPFLGSGTTGVACKMLNRNFIGYEINKHYYDIANERMNNINAKGD